MNDCIFCRIINGQIPSFKIFEDEHVLVILDIGPLNQGHTLVMPKAHFEFFDECPDGISTKISAAVIKVAKAVKDASGADGYNVLCNNGKAAGQLVGHVHFHIIPRFTGDGVFDRWPAKQYEIGQADKILEKIKAKL